jgi:hypothetical protein
MNSIIELLRSNQNMVFVNEDGIEERLELLPPLTPAEMTAFEKTLPCPIPDEIRELLLVTGGFRGVLEEVNFGGPLLEFGLEEIFPHAISIAGDGFGNFWVIDLTSESHAWGPVLFASHDAPVVVYQCDDLAHFVVEVFRFGNKPWKSEIDDAHEELSTKIWRDNPGVLTHEDCLQSGDIYLQEFARSLDATWLFVDLRNAKLGDGFSCGRYGPKTGNRRFGEKRIFAYQKKGFGQRFLNSWR